MLVALRSQDEAACFQILHDFPANATLPVVEGPRLALISSCIFPVTPTQAPTALSHWSPPLQCSWPCFDGPVCSCSGPQVPGLQQSIRWWWYFSTGEKELGADVIRTAQSPDSCRSNWNELFSRFEYWFAFVLSVFLPGSRLKLVSGKKAWHCWRSSSFKMKVFVCWWSHIKPILWFLMTVPVEDLKTLHMEQKDLILFVRAFQIWPELGQCTPAWKWLLLSLLERQKSPPQVQDLSLQRLDCTLGCLRDHNMKLMRVTMDTCLCGVPRSWDMSRECCNMANLWKQNQLKHPGRRRDETIPCLLEVGLSPSGGSILIRLMLPWLPTSFGGVPELQEASPTCLQDSRAVNYSEDLLLMVSGCVSWIVDNLHQLQRNFILRQLEKLFPLQISGYFHRRLYRAHLKIDWVLKSLFPKKFCFLIFPLLSLLRCKKYPMSRGK